MWRYDVRDTQLPAQCVVVQNYSNQNNVFHFRYTREHERNAVSTPIHIVQCVSVLVWYSVTVDTVSLRRKALSDIRMTRGHRHPHPPARGYERHGVPQLTACETNQNNVSRPPAPSHPIPYTPRGTHITKSFYVGAKTAWPAG